MPGLIEDVLDNARPVHARMVHGADRNGNPTQIPMPYGPNGEVTGPTATLEAKLNYVTIQRYRDHRRPDVQAMTDMAVEHYHKLSVGVKSSLSRTKKRIESALQICVPALDWATLYWRIQFSHERVSVIRKKDARQNRILRSFIPSLFLSVFLATVFLFAH